MTLDPGPVFNRQFAHEHGWTGEHPLANMPRGRQKIHGVPFHIAGGTFSEKSDCLVMRSIRARTGGGKPLPERVTIPVGRKARAVYVLHGCGYAERPGAFAWYEFHFANGKILKVPVVSRGSDPAPGASGKKIRGANIQDWWPGPVRPQFQARHARKYVVTDNGNPLSYERYLYTLEWVNPDSGNRLKSIVIRSDPGAEATLGVLAITLLGSGGAQLDC